ncbi:DUF362 domain-containing protein [uncultured Methanobacterium sp.]|uniref:DUF362 domain-containing protein n=1 Tax=uncultured Methanobacterium sp. TaxID=176306 RepID=UPI002AA6B352|nr:DUF362 domain-containing protein [uncultured Methanobacterium sp.]
MNECLIGIKKITEVKNEEEIKNAVFELLDQMKSNEQIKIPPNANILIKPNICLVKCHESGTTVDPFIVKSLVDWLILNFDIKSIIIAEADATQLNIDVGFMVLGWRKFFEEYDNVNLLNLTKDDYVDVKLADGLYFENMKMSKTFMESDYLISVAKLKTHTMTKITGILKNQYGANPIKHKIQYHDDLDEVIYDLNKVRIPDLCLVDGVIAMEGAGPVSGIPNPVGLLIVGNDPVAVDHASAKLMGFNPRKVSHLKLAHDKGLGSFDYDVFGEDINDVATKFRFVSPWKEFVTKVYQNKFIHKIPLWKKVALAIFRR